ncbi:uncharacterized protein SAPINGB_P002475 [Magnusiomyces paraingens]|uniref:Uncharacterized protein n=1 Tax=Magnusiomyces paraingens TaxID=2606893 RepID=A0A5E8BG70_9ASCO|nr:uncharacterized protein SAPINGB_P002475 [Saprochaete ingens]VVT49851.1 unnamed protein product [Saprochaete ingens]
MDSASVREEAMGVLFEPGKRMARIDPEILEPADLGRVLSFYQRLNHIGLRISLSPELNIVFAMTQAISLLLLEASKWASVVEQYFFNNPDGTFHRDLILAVLNNNKVSAAAREDPQSHLWGLPSLSTFSNQDLEDGACDSVEIPALVEATSAAFVKGRRIIDGSTKWCQSRNPSKNQAGIQAGIFEESWPLSDTKHGKGKQWSKGSGGNKRRNNEDKQARKSNSDGQNRVAALKATEYLEVARDDVETFALNLFSDSVWRTHDVSFHTVPSGDCLAYFGEEKVGRVGGARDAKSHICANIVPVKFTRNIVPPTGSFKFSGNSIDWDQICRQGPEAMRKVDKSAFAVGKGLPVLSQSLKFIAKEAVLNSQALDCHVRFAHCSLTSVKHLAKLADPPFEVTKRDEELIKDCVISSESTAPLAQIHADLVGPIGPASSGARYMLNIIDAFSGYIYAFALESKDEALGNLSSSLKASLDAVELGQYLLGSAWLYAVQVNPESLCPGKPSVAPVVAHQTSPVTLPKQLHILDEDDSVDLALSGTAELTREASAVETASQSGDDNQDAVDSKPMMKTWMGLEHILGFDELEDSSDSEFSPSDVVMDSSTKLEEAPARCRGARKGLVTLKVLPRGTNNPANNQLALAAAELVRATTELVETTTSAKSVCQNG